MNRQDYGVLRARLSSQGLLEVSNVKGAATVAALALVTIAIGIGVARTDWQDWQYWLLQAVAGVVLFLWFVVLHECGHRTLFTSLRVNTIVGHVASVFCLIPYYAWRNVHLQHHRWVGVIDRDPTQRGLLDLRRSGDFQNALFRFVWRLWIPIPFMKFLFQVFWGYGLERQRAGDLRNAKRGWLSIAVCVLPHMVFVALLGFKSWILAFLPMLLVFYWMIENMNMPQHSELFPYLSDTHPLPIPIAEQDEITRSTHLPDIVSTLIALNFNRHTEHHLFASAPWYSLNRIRRELNRSGSGPVHEVPYFSFMRALRKRDPITIYRDALPVPAAQRQDGVDGGAAPLQGAAR